MIPKQTAYGWREIDDQDINSFLSCVIQTYEFSLIEACYDLWLKEKRHFHDGFSIVLEDGADKGKVIAKLQNAVAGKGKVLGIKARLSL